MTAPSSATPLPSSHTRTARVVRPGSTGRAGTPHDRARAATGRPIRSASTYTKAQVDAPPSATVMPTPADSSADVGRLIATKITTAAPHRVATTATTRTGERRALRSCGPSGAVPARSQVRTGRSIRHPHHRPPTNDAAVYPAATARFVLSTAPGSGSSGVGTTSTANTRTTAAPAALDPTIAGSISHR